MKGGFSREMLVQGNNGGVANFKKIPIYGTNQSSYIKWRMGRPSVEDRE